MSTNILSSFFFFFFNKALIRSVRIRLLVNLVSLAFYWANVFCRYPDSNTQHLHEFMPASLLLLPVSLDELNKSTNRSFGPFSNSLYSLLNLI